MLRRDGADVAVGMSGRFLRRTLACRCGGEVSVVPWLETRSTRRAEDV
jgi:hypothetical protein